MEKKLFNLICISVAIICSFIFILMIISSLDLFYKTSQNLIIGIAFTTVAILLNVVIAMLSVKINNYSVKLFVVILVLISAIEYLLWNIYASTLPVSDYGVLLEGAERILSGTFASESFDKTNYFYFYNFQIGYTFYLASVMSIFGKSLFWFKALDTLYMTLTSIFIYKVVSKISTKQAAAAASMLHATFIPLIIGSSVINNQHLSSLLMIAAVYYILDRKLASSVIAGVLLGFTQIFRPIAGIFLIATFLYYLLMALGDRKYKQFILCFVIICLSFTLIVRGFDTVIMANGLSPSPISKANAKYFKFVLGLRGSGVYNIKTENARRTQVFFDLQTLNFNYDKYNEVCLDVIKKSIRNYRYTAWYIKDKMYKFFGYKDNQYDFALDYSKRNSFTEALRDIGHLQYIIILFASLILIIIRMIKKKDLNDIFTILIVGFIMVHILIETQTRYRYETYIFLIIISSQVVNYFKCKTSKIRSFE